MKGNIKHIAIGHCSFATYIQAWQADFIPANELWISLGGDKGGSTMEMSFQIFNSAR